MAFKPSFGFFDPPGIIENKTIQTKPVQKPLPRNDLKIQKSEKVKTKIQFQTLFESKLNQSFHEEQKPSEQSKVTESLPIDSEELKDQGLQKALSGNFAKVKVKKQQAKKPSWKPGENFVKLNLSKSKKFSRVGKTLNQKFRRKKNYFDSELLKKEERLTFSSGYGKRQKLENYGDIQYDQLFQILQNDFGFANWKEGQDKVLKKVWKQRNVLSVLPTGGGKSLVYQMFARTKGPVIVISPLLSLIYDQLEKLPPCLSGAALLNNNTYVAKQTIFQGLEEGEIDVVFMTPEKFLQEGTELNVKLICIDEVHSISPLSHTFRSVYAILADVILKAPIIGLTAPCQLSIINQIKEKLQINDVVELKRYFSPSLNISVHIETDLIRAVGDIVRTRRFKNGGILIYSFTTYNAQTVCDWIKLQGLIVRVFHSGLSDNYKEQLLVEFQQNKIQVLVSTIALGLGFEKLDLKGVIILHPPKNIEQLIQYAGRAGRAGQNCNVSVIFTLNDVFWIRSLLFSSFIEESEIQTIMRSMQERQSLKRGRQEVEFKGRVLYLQELTKQVGVDKEILVLLFMLLQRKGYLKFEGVMPITAQVQFYKKSSVELAKEYAIISQVLDKGRNYQGKHKVSLQILADSLDISVKEASNALRRLQGTGFIACEFLDDAIVTSQVQSDVSVEEIANLVYQELMEILLKNQSKFEQCYMILRQLDSPLNKPVNALDSLNFVVNEYMTETYQQEIPQFPIIQSEIELSFEYLCSVLDYEPSPKDIANILIGVSTKRTPHDRWKGQSIWKSYAKCKFMDVYDSARYFLSNNKKAILD